VSGQYQAGYPLTEFLSWASYMTVFESGVEQNVPGACYPGREWDVSYYATASGPTNVNDLRDFLHRQQARSRVFLFREPERTCRGHVKLGHGNGARTTWVVPVFDASSLTFFVNSISVGYSVSTGTGVASLGIVTLSAPPPTHVVTFSFLDGFYVPMVAVKDVFQYSHEGPMYGTVKFSLRELKLDYPEM